MLHEEYLRHLFIKGNPQATYENIAKELSRSDILLFIVDYCYNGDWYGGYIPGKNICDILTGVKTMKDILPPDVRIEVDFNLLPVLTSDLSIEDEEIETSLIAYFLYEYREIIDITNYKDQMINYFSNQDEFEKCAVLLNYNAPASVRF